MLKDYKSFALPGTTPKYNPDRPGNVQHIFLNIALDVEKEVLQGHCYITLNPIRDGITTLELNAVDMEISKVCVDGLPQKFDYSGEKIVIYLTVPTVVETPMLIDITYKVETPKLGITFVKPTKDYPDRPVQIWTQGEPEQSRYWYPCFDYPLQICTSEIRVEVPNPLITVSNGKLIHKEEKTETTVYHWMQDKPHPNCLMTLVAGDFCEIKDEWNGVPVLYYGQKKLEDWVKRSGEKTPKMMEFYSQKFGVPFPWAKYAQSWVHDFIWGGMENTSATTNTEKALMDERASLDYSFSEILVAHELVHQWFGDYIVINHWSQLWVKEGAATYGEYLWTEYEYGKEEFDYYKFLETNEYLDEDSSVYRRPIATHVFKEAEDMYDRHSYSKGGLVYNMIRATLGDSLFEKALQYFLMVNKHQNVDSEKFLEAIEKSTGRNLRPLFDQYVYRGGHPDFKISFDWDNHHKFAKVMVVQEQVSSDKDIENLFNLEIPLEFGFISENLSNTKFNLKLSQKEQSFYFPLDKEPDFIDFDPNNDYLKTVKLDLSIPKLKNQLKYSKYVVSRIFAAQALAKKGGLESLRALGEALKDDSFWGVRAEIASEIGKVKLDKTFDILTQGLSDSDARVRKAVVTSMSNIKTHYSFEVLKNIAITGDPSYFTEAEAMKSLGKIAYFLKEEYVSETIKILKNVLATREGWNEVLRSGAIAGIANLKDSEEALEIIIEYTKIGISQTLRLNSLASLGCVLAGQSKANQERVLEILEQTSADSYIISERSVITSLGMIYTAKSVQILLNIAEKTLYGRIRNMALQTVKKVQAGMSPEKSLSQIRDEMEEIKKTNQELKSRLEEMEGRKEK